MLFLEMSRDPFHGGGTWEFSKCVWAPTEKRKGGHWPFWDKVFDIKAGDTILHLRGKSPGAEFVGFSTAATDGYETSSRPPDPKAWSYTDKFYRADLRNFTPFDKPFNLKHVFAARDGELRNYFENNKGSHKYKRNIFYVVQRGRLQCLNGAYLSEIDEELFTCLFGETVNLGTPNAPSFETIKTGTQLATVKARVGQAMFSRQIKSLYGHTCCFPGCGLSDSRFLISSHIARWADNEKLRGELGNGVCFCIFHDKAFELGVFTIDQQLKIYINPKENGSSIYERLCSSHGKPILNPHGTLLLPEALQEHWQRIGIDSLS